MQTSVSPRPSCYRLPWLCRMDYLGTKRLFGIFQFLISYKSVYLWFLRRRSRSYKSTGWGHKAEREDQILEKHMPYNTRFLKAQGVCKTRLLVDRPAADRRDRLDVGVRPLAGWTWSDWSTDLEAPRGKSGREDPRPHDRSRLIMKKDVHTIHP
jgi:hypothetical protein